ncbi:MAG: 30S ribosomal protein S2 [Acidimicrobiales bacterium]|nr:30S ribosomal protein S2 [Acidimicrobiales bacterium]MYD32374.1 30S ribosomal protein S2 [Acidimicrobiales bacterium]MYI10918.1 30S ribosomal protein S2 [Acidimicrobiales bacterium]
MSAVVTMSDLLAAGVHFGHQTRRWNPKMERFLWGERNGIYIIDLRQTLQLLEDAYAYVRDTVAGGGTILFVGTKRQAQYPIQRHANACGMPYVNQRWLGGMLTNFRTIRGRVTKMLEYERMQSAGDFNNMPKKEALLHTRELTKLQRNLNGIRNMDKLPDAVFVLDTPKEHIAVAEAVRLKLPVVAVADSNSDPDPITYVIPGNDDAIRSTELLCRVIADAALEGRYMAERSGVVVAPAGERSPEEEARIAAQQAEAQRAAMAEAAAREARIAADQAKKAAAAAAVPDMRSAEAPAAAADVGGDVVPAAEASVPDASTSDASAAAEPATETGEPAGDATEAEALAPSSASQGAS